MENSNNLKRKLEDQEATLTRNALLSLTALNQDTVLLDYGHVIIRRNYKDLKTVRLLGGGSMGLNLSYCHAVGKGMLTAAIIEEDFTPSSRKILRTIKELHEGENAGIFVISRAGSEMYNFGLAVRRAQMDCQMRVKLLPVNDNMYCSNHKTCGFVLLTKIMGAMAEEGAFFDDMWSFYNKIIQAIVSIPLHYENYESPRKKSLLLLDEFESTFNRIIDDYSQNVLKLHPSLPTVALINTSPELNRVSQLCLTGQIVERLRQLGVSLVRLYSGAFVSAPPNTASLTIMKVLEDKIIDYLDAPCGALGWRQITHYLPEVTLKNELPGLLVKKGRQPVTFKGPHLSEAQSALLVKATQFACDALISCEKQLNIIDAEQSRGNVGSRLKKFAERVNKKIKSRKITTQFPYTFFKKMSVTAESAMGGTMGTVYGVMFEGAANAFGDYPDDEPITSDMWLNAMKAGKEAIWETCNDIKVLNTMYYPIKMCGKVMTKKSQLYFIECFNLGVGEAEEAAQRTRQSGQKYPDAGAHAVGIWMRAVFEAVKLNGSTEATGSENLVMNH